MDLGAVQQWQAYPNGLKPEGLDLDEVNQYLAGLTAAERVNYALQMFPGPHILTSSFGAQSAVSLHLLTQAQPDSINQTRAIVRLV